MNASTIGQLPAIDIRGLTKQYKKGKGETLTAVDHLDLSIEPGQVFGFLGENGAGKTTTIKMACGLVIPTKGEVHLNGYHVQRQRGKAMRQIGAVLEGTRNVYWRLSALENLLYFGRLKGVYGKELRQRAQLLLEELELWDRRNDKIRTFSRGMQQKVAIACALIADPPIVLLDEPTLGLDVKAAVTVRNWIEHLASTRNKTIILTTHQLDIAQSLCDRVAIISKGKLLIDQPMDEMLDLFRTTFYEIKLSGHLNGQAQYLPASLSVQTEGEISVLSGSIEGEAQLYDVIDKLRQLNLALVSVTPIEPNLEQIFIDYVDSASASHIEGNTTLEPTAVVQEAI